MRLNQMLKILMVKQTSAGEALPEQRISYTLSKRTSEPAGKGYGEAHFWAIKYIIR